MDNIWTIELNLDDDFSSSCAYHIDTLRNTIAQNIITAEDTEKKRKPDHWALVGLASSSLEATEKCKKLRELLCKRNGREVKNLPFDLS